MDKVWKERAGEADRGARLDGFWSERLAGEGVSRARLQEWIKAGLAEVDGTASRKPGLRLAGGEELVLRGRLPEACARPEEGEVEILYRDPSLLVVDKPAGLTVHPAPSCPEGTLVQRLLTLYPDIARLDAWRPGIVHRIDKDTSGLLVVALDEVVRLKLSEAFARREVSKTYLTLVHGSPERDQGSVDLPIGRHPTARTRMAVVRKGGREARTHYRVLWREERGLASLLSVNIETGRTHQIRVHLSHQGHPIIGDRTYGAAAQARLEATTGLPGSLMGRQMLHAFRLSFVHPATGKELSFAARPPMDFLRLPLLLAARRTQRVAVVGPAGCGKSTLAGLLAEAGAATFSADKVVAGVYRRGGEGWEFIRRRWGERFVPDPAGDVDKVRLLAAMLESDAVRAEVVDMVHPLVQYRLEEFWRDASASHARVAAAEVPLFIEAGWHKRGLADVLVGVECGEVRRMERLSARPGWSGEIAAVVDSWQRPWAEKRKLCDLTVDNSGTLDELRTAAGRVMAGLRRMRTDSILALRDRLVPLLSP